MVDNYLFFRGTIMSMMEDGLLSALKELLETSELMTSGRNFQLMRCNGYRQAIEWAKPVIMRADNGKNR
jgi:tRNA A37 N6-isopentenylltransferase MiaA